MLVAAQSGREILILIFLTWIFLCVAPRIIYNLEAKNWIQLPSMLSLLTSCNSFITWKWVLLYLRCSRSFFPPLFDLGWDWFLRVLATCSGNLLSRILHSHVDNRVGSRALFSLSFTSLPCLRLVSYFPCSLFCFVAAILRTKLLVVCEFYTLFSKGVCVFIELCITS